VQACLQCGQSYIDDSAVDEGHAGTEYCRRQDPMCRLSCARNVGIRRSNYGFIARGFHLGLRVRCLWIMFRQFGG